MNLSIMSGSRPGRWVVWIFYRTINRPLPVPHAAGWMMIPEHSVDQVLETGALRSLYPQDVLEAARRMDRQRREHDERYAKTRRALMRIPCSTTTTARDLCCLEVALGPVCSGGLLSDHERAGIVLPSVLPYQSSLHLSH